MPIPSSPAIRPTARKTSRSGAPNRNDRMLVKPAATTRVAPTRIARYIASKNIALPGFHGRCKRHHAMKPAAINGPRVKFRPLPGLWLPKSSEGQDRVQPAEGERIGERRVDRERPGGVGHIVEVALRIRPEVVH